MKRTILSFFAFVLTTVSTITFAQDSEVSGTVIGKWGLPLAGVEVTAGNSTTTTTSDGRFTIAVPAPGTTITCTCPGWDTKRQRSGINDGDMLIEMRPWVRKGFFVALSGAYDFSSTTGATKVVITPSANGLRDIKSTKFGKIGLMGGYLGRWGAYTRLMFPVADAESYSKGIHATAGGICHLYQPFYMYLGAGYAGNLLTDIATVSNPNDPTIVESFTIRRYESSVALEAGFIFCSGKFFGSLGYCCTPGPTLTGMGIQAAVGYCF